MSDPIRQQGEYEDYPTSDEESGRSAGMIWALRGAGPLAAFLVWLAMGSSPDLSTDARWVAAIGTLMAIWWISEAIPLAATSLLPIVLIPALTDRTVGETTAPYASSIVFLFLGGFLIAIAMEKWNLHRRVALLTLKQVGVAPRRIVLGMMIATGFLSMWVSNTATTLMMLPIGFSVLALVTGKMRAGGPNVSGEVAAHSDEPLDPNIARFGTCLVLAIAWSASMGGLGTLLGSPPNAIIAGYAADELGRDIGFLEWMLLGFPLAVTFIIIGWLLMTRVLYRFDIDEIPGGEKMIQGEIAKLGKLSQGEKMVALVFGGAAFMWVVPGLLATIPGISARFGWLGELNDTAIAIAAGLAMFILPGKGRKDMVLNWKDAEDGLPWGVLLLFGGGLSLASAVASTGLDGWFGQQVTGLAALPVILIIASVVTLVLFLTEVTSNTATAATFIPILGGVAVGIGMDPMTLLIPAAFAATCAFMLPVGTPPNAIVFSTGRVTIAQMARGGLVLNIVGVMLITLFVYALGGWALGLVL
ncbi:DASS family sodium-coupled anion symporter [Pontixanthobacter aestiaquae]|uniref:DASS family sodium-coupled anion symporter n=1 Tax=Pontixanthobacter aestiaquae TaxID=1509367 RepID=A0A844Z950_9SPHN|nr:DASS family sodium-coupled anion symporter [Pontixanthobacter aestiaquae]MDN3644653.1 DASS family sodium-coupled anion symporter [Pontixanthobacter aestiaquae]MXO84338.1 DASS family sodium-coupled anion symporter [Pontixanthobacter aestiaquae]